MHRGFRPCLDLLGPLDGGGGGNRTPVRRYSRPGTTCLARCLVSDGGNTTCEAPTPIPLCSRCRLTGRRRPRSCDDDLHPRAQAQGVGARPKRPERRRRRSRLSFCSWINEESYPSACARRFRTPSKPVHPRECRCRRQGQYRRVPRVHKPARTPGGYRRLSSGMDADTAAPRTR